MILKLGYKASAEQFAPKQLLEFSVDAEQAGFDSVFVSDHFQPWKHTDGHAPSALAWLGALGASTQRIIMGTSVLTPTFRYHPSVVAQVFGTLGSMFPGRVILGVGTGEGLNEVPSTGMKWPEMKERFARLREALTLIRKLWSEDHVTFEGEYYQTLNATIYDKPGLPLPIYVAGAGPMIAKYAGRSADGFICTSGKKWDLYTDILLPNVTEGIALSGKPKPDYDRMIEMKVSFDTDKQKALEDTRHWAALALTPEEPYTVLWLYLARDRAGQATHDSLAQDSAKLDRCMIETLWCTNLWNHCGQCNQSYPPCNFARSKAGSSQELIGRRGR